MRAAVVHDAFTQRGGGERVAVALSSWLHASLHAAAVRDDAIPPGVSRGDIDTTLVQALVGRGVRLRAVAPLLPLAFRRLDVGRVDVVVSSSAAFAHHVRVPPGAAHVCYCHTPPRFLWEPEDYFRDARLQGLALAPALAAVRRLDVAASRRVDVYVANSRHIAAKIRRAYGREAVVVYPPVDGSAFRATTERSGRFLVVSRLRAQKRLDLVVQAANLRGLPVDVIGSGPDLDDLRRQAGPTVRFLGPRPDDETRAAMARSIGVVVPAVQDFGLTLVEAQASGRPPIAFGQGGALEIVEDGRTGILFDEQTVAGVAAGMERAMRTALDPALLVASARRFDTPAFHAGMRDAIARAHALRTGALQVATPAGGGRAGRPLPRAGNLVDVPVSLEGSGRAR